MVARKDLSPHSAAKTSANVDRKSPRAPAEVGHKRALELPFFPESAKSFEFLEQKMFLLAFSFAGGQCSIYNKIVVSREGLSCVRRPSNERLTFAQLLDFLLSFFSLFSCCFVCIPGFL